MNKKPVLVVMAAGMGSRYGGLKQIDKIGPCGEIIIDYSLYDAKKAGFETVIFIIKKEIEKDFKEIISKGAGKHLDVKYAFQSLDDVPAGFKIPEGRVKPWGTGHAILAAKDLIDGPFVAINADDYYGPDAFKSLYDYLTENEDGEKYEFCMAGYKIENTLTENGTVARGVCVEKDGYLQHIDERTKIGWQGEDICFSEDDGASWTKVERGTLVSMNFFGFTKSIMKELEDKFPAALENIAKTNPLKGEFYIPIVTSELINEGKANVKVLPCHDKWFGVTYKEDKPVVVESIRKLTADGRYPENLWGR